MATRKEKFKNTDPIPRNQQKSWRELIERSRQAVDQMDKGRFELILISGEVEAKYGEGRVQRWADESGISYTQAKQYRWLNAKGLDATFIKRWVRSEKNPTGLSYSVIRSIATFCGTLKDKYAEDYLKHAVEHKATVVSIQAYMFETTAPTEANKAAAESIKMAIRDKQDHEGFNDYLRTRLEEMIEQYPETEDMVLKTVITTPEDIQALEEAAGIRTKEEQREVEAAGRYISKMRQMRRYLRMHQKEIVHSITYAHERSSEIQDNAKYVIEACDALINAEIPDGSELEGLEDVEEFEIDLD